MPGYDRTGPNGMGPMTGRGMGACSGDAAGYTPGGRGFGRRGRMGRNRMRTGNYGGWSTKGYGQSPATDTVLMEEVQMCREEMATLLKRLEEVERKSSEQ